MLKLSTKLTPHFSAAEFFITSQAGGQAGLWEDWQRLPASIRQRYEENLRRLAASLESIRIQLDSRPIKITSGWRSARVNHLVGGAPLSKHLTGEAADIVVMAMHPLRVQQRLENRWPYGMGYGKTFTHIDMRPYKARFNY